MAATGEGVAVTSPCELPQAQSASKDAIVAIRPENVMLVMLPPEAACPVIAQRQRRATIRRYGLTHDRASPIEPLMDVWVWLNFTLLFLAGGLTPGPAVMLVTTASIRYGFWPSITPALGICLANLIWIALAASGVAVVAKAFPDAFLVLKVLGIAFIAWLAWRTAFGAPVDLLRREPPPRSRLFVNGVGLQLANPNALVYFGGLLPTYFNPDQDLIPQVIISMLTVTVCEMFGLMVYASGADALAKRFRSQAFATGFFRVAAAAMLLSAGFAVYLTWATTGR
jgi:homoserine/homoserine lactone efflux protein